LGGAVFIEKWGMDEPNHKEGCCNDVKEISSPSLSNSSFVNS
jgi:hypothetical protein